MKRRGLLGRIFRIFFSLSLGGKDVRRTDRGINLRVYKNFKK
jgi:hypothetical protein